MNKGIRQSSRLWILGFALLGSASMAGCISDDSDPDDGGDETGGTGGASGASGAGGSTSGSGGTTGGSSSGGSGGGPAGTVCESPITISASKPGIATFDDYDGSANLATWSFPLGGDTSTGVLAGTFGYGDETTGFPEAFEMVAGNGSTYALSISDTLADEYGGGMGLWLSECLNATAFGGISFWVRGNSPTGTAKLSLLMQETTSATASTADDSIGTCTGTDETCVHPSYMFTVSDTWTEVEVAWGAFTAGNAAGTPVVPDGRNVWQIQFDVGLVWAPDEAGVYHPTPAAYEFVVDGLTFY